jgi:hypothetical protein
LWDIFNDNAILPFISVCLQRRALSEAELKARTGPDVSVISNSPPPTHCFLTARSRGQTDGGAETDKLARRSSGHESHDSASVEPSSTKHGSASSEPASPTSSTSMRGSSLPRRVSSVFTSAGFPSSGLSEPNSVFPRPHVSSPIRKQSLSLSSYQQNLNKVLQLLICPLSLVT